MYNQRKVAKKTRRNSKFIHGLRLIGRYFGLGWTNGKAFEKKMVVKEGDRRSWEVEHTREGVVMMTSKQSKKGKYPKRAVFGLVVFFFEN
jgi:hypothetical protein